MDGSHGADHVPPLVLALQRVAGSLEELDVRVAADDDVQRAEFGGIHEEPDVTGMEPVEAAGDDDSGRVGRRAVASNAGNPARLAA